MDIAEYCKAVRADVDEAMEQKVTSVLAGTLLAPQGRAAISRGIKSGKRLRGMLVCLVCESLGGERRDAMKLAVGIELVHAASLVHDDIIDRDEYRRGKPAVWRMAGIGSGGAILIGDFLYALGTEALAVLQGGYGHVVAKAMVQVALGASKEFVTPGMLNAGSCASRYAQPYQAAACLEDISRLKTGALFGAACKVGALAADVPNFADAAYLYGERCGEAFQSADDLADSKDHPDTSLLRNRIAERASFALEAIRDFPDNKYTAMLREMPQFMIDAMLGGTAQR